MPTTTATPPARDRLLDAALRRFDAEGAFNATLDEVRRDAGVSVGALYHHFADKQALATALYVAALADYQGEFRTEVLQGPADPREAVEGGVRFHLRWCAAHRAEARFLLTGRGWVDADAVTDHSRAFYREVRAWYDGHAHHGALRPLPFDLVNALWLGPSQELLRHWLRDDAERLAPRVADELARAAWHSLKGDAA